MNESQNTADNSSSQYGQTQNPQTPGGQNLATEAAGNLQTVSTPNLFSGQSDVSITQVGDGQFTAFTPENTTTTTVSEAPKTSKNHNLVLIGSGVLIVAVLIASWLMIRRQSSY